jgi:hypothetical protein
MVLWGERGPAVRAQLGKQADGRKWKDETKATHVMEGRVWLVIKSLKPSSAGEMGERNVLPECCVVEGCVVCVCVVVLTVQLPG